MNTQLKKLMLVVTILLLTACGQVGTPSAPDLAVTEAPTSDPVVISEPTKDVPTATASDGSTPESFSQYVGLRYPPSPAGLFQDFSMLIENSDLYSLSLGKFETMATDGIKCHSDKAMKIT